MKSHNPTDNFQAVIYDMDGLIIDSEPLWRATEVKVFNAIGVPLTLDMTIQTMGRRINEVVDFWYAQYPWNSPSKEEIEQEVVRGVVNGINSDGDLLEGTLESIKFFKQKGLRLALASSSSLFIIHTVLSKFGLEKYFEVIHSAEGELFGKPHPAVYESTIKLLGVPAANCIALEDSLNGVRSAKAAGTFCIAVPDYRVHGAEEFHEADIVLRSLKEIDESLWERLLV